VGGIANEGSGASSPSTATTVQRPSASARARAANGPSTRSTTGSQSRSTKRSRSSGSSPSSGTYARPHRIAAVIAWTPTVLRERSRATKPGRPAAADSMRSAIARVVDSSVA